MHKPASQIHPGSADCIIFNEVLHEMPVRERESSFKAMRKALKDDGVLFFIDILAPKGVSDYSRKAGELPALVEFFEKPFGSDLMTMTELKKLFKKTGFGPIKHLEPADNVVVALAYRHRGSRK